MKQLEAFRQDFPILHQTMNGHPLVYLDNAATAQKPRAVIDRLTQFYEAENANVHRGVYPLSEQATIAFEQVRDQVQHWIHAKRREEIVFTKGATEAINLLAASYGRTYLKPGDEIILSTLEHHANIVPWQMLAAEKDLIIRVIPMLDNGDLDLLAYQSLLNSRTRLVGLTQTSNAIGTVNPIQEMIHQAHQVGAVVLIDACQSIVHLSIDVQALDCDFLVFSAHKLYGPTGLGVLYGKASHLNDMPPYQGGGDMIQRVRFERTEYQRPPQRFEAGTPPIAEVIAFGAGLSYLKALPWQALHAHEQALFEEAKAGLKSIPGVSLVGTPAVQAPILSFNLEGIHPHDAATIIAKSGVALRAGHHCAMPTIDAFALPATLRVSFSFYNTPLELQQLFEAVEAVKRVFLK